MPLVRHQSLINCSLTRTLPFQKSWKIQNFWVSLVTVWERQTNRGNLVTFLAEVMSCRLWRLVSEAVSLRIYAINNIVANKWADSLSSTSLHISLFIIPSGPTDRLHQCVTSNICPRFMMAVYCTNTEQCDDKAVFSLQCTPYTLSDFINVDELRGQFGKYIRHVRLSMFAVDDQM